MNNAPIDEAAYGKLLRKALPRPIRTEKDNERYLQVVERLMDLGERLTPEQHELMELLVTLIERFEAECYSLSAASPVEALRELMEARGMKLAGLAALIGSKGVASEILSGKRVLSKPTSSALPSISASRRKSFCSASHFCSRSQHRVPFRVG